MKRSTAMMLSLFAALLLVLGACANESKDTGDVKENDNAVENPEKGEDEDKEGMDHEEMNHSSSGEVPEALKKAKDPKFKEGSTATIEADHMKGMDGAKATIKGAYDTTAYVVTYTPATGGEEVKNHKWVIQEEIKDAGDKALEPGSEVTIEADHMEGMKGAKAVIESAEETTVYMVDYKPETGGEEVKNHKWVTESELK